jgi:hypothetical protein
MEGKTFRLGEYRITDFGSGLIGWEAHYEFGVQRSGRCFQLEEILVLGEFEEEKTGYLKGEFLDRLTALPPWNHTRYFCLSSQLQTVGTGRVFDNDQLKEIGARELQRKSTAEGIGATETGPFRLSRYRITSIPDKGFVWESWGDGNTVVTGNCSLESGILLMGPPMGLKELQNKREFIQHLRRLPRWQETLFWCRQDVLRPTQVPAKPKIPWPLQRPQIPKQRFIKTKGVKKSGANEGAEKSTWSGFTNRIPLWRGLVWRWQPAWPSLSRVRVSLASGFKFPSLPRIFSRRPRPKQPDEPPLSGKSLRKTRIIWASLILALLLLALFLTTLYLVSKSGHGHSHYWKHYYKSQDH